MPLIEWNSQLSVGIDVFDEDHRKLVQMLNDLYDAMQEGKGSDSLGEILKGLEHYVGTHFSREEVYMEKHGYPGLAAHRQRHIELTGKLKEVMQQYSSGKSSILTLEVMRFLRQWLVEHIQREDRAYSRHLKDAGMQ